MRWYIECFKKSFTFKGRARRKEYWMFTLVEALVMALSYALLGVSFVPYVPDSYRWIILIAILLIAAVHLPASISVTVRRLHDTNINGGLYFISFVPGGALVLFIFTLLDGTPGNNRYGEDPKKDERVSRPDIAAPARQRPDDAGAVTRPSDAGGVMRPDEMKP